MGPRAATRSAAFGLALVLALAVALLGPVAPTAQASGQRICSGYSSCAAAGYSDDGYAEQSQRYWWNMELGHNCTNYAAYRIVRSGVANTRPWTGNGDARNWGHEMASITDQVPRVGSIAWWDAGAGGHGRLGHVAYVEQVVSDDVVIVSEDVFEGDFHWTRVTRSSGGWPSGFIHFNDERLTRLAAPSVVGRAKVGRPLSVTSGRWEQPVRVRYQWLADGRAVRGATETRFTPTSSHAGDRIRVRLTVSSTGYEPVVVTTGATDRVGRGVLDVARPVRFSGTAQVGRTVQVHPPRIAPRPDRVVVRWHLGDRVLRGQRGRRLHLGPAMVGKDLRVEVTSHRAGYEPRTVRARLGAVRPGRIVVTRPYRVDGQPVVGRQLTLVPGRYTPADARTGQLWFRDGDPISGATATTYVVRPEDVGHRITAVVALARRGYESLLVGASAGVATTG